MADISAIKLPNNVIYNIKDASARTRLTTISLGTTWAGSGPYTQTVSISGVSANEKIDLQPDAATLNILMDDGVTAMYVENNDGVITVYALGAKPTSPLYLQASICPVTIIYM